jgi:hypothetical protein
MASSARQAVTPLNIQQLLAAKQMGLGDYIAQAEMKSRTPTLRERIGNLIYDAAQGAGLRQSAQSMRSNAETAVDFVPGVGEAVGAQEAGRDLAAGNYGRAALGGLGTAAGVLPVGDLAGGIAKAIFGGIAAKTANKPALEIAEKMLKEGADKQAIWDATGWFKGTDGKWRFEIDDSGTALRGAGNVKDVTDKRGHNLKDVFLHPDNYRAYPHMEEIQVHGGLLPGNASGQYTPPGLMSVDPAEIVVNDYRRGVDPRSTILHEMQHDIQGLEGFAGGGNSISTFGNSDPKIRNAVAEEMEKLLRTLPRDEYASELRKSWQEATEADVAESYKGYLKANKESRSSVYNPVNRAAQETAAMNVYKRMAGEVEARNVQTRMNMPMERRRNTPPWATQDTPDEQQIVRRR